MNQVKGIKCLLKEKLMNQPRVSQICLGKNNEPTKLIKGIKCVLKKKLMNQLT